MPTSGPVLAAAISRRAQRAATRLTFAAACLAILAFIPGAALALCGPIAGSGAPWRIVPAAFEAPPSKGTVELTYLGHSSFLIRSAGGIAAVTDYNDHIRPPLPPDIATMNIAHDTHYSVAPDSRIKHLLRGWGEDGPAQHALTVGDMHVRNVVTNLRSWEGGVRLGSNSIFVFEMAGLCIAHLGHLHHRLTDTHLAQLGMIDVLLVPVDGSFTLAQDLMAEVVRQIGPALVIPMHAFSPASLARFVGYLQDGYAIKRGDSPTVALSRVTLPHRQVLMLPAF